jgi:hypothetical protein
MAGYPVASYHSARKGQNKEKYYFSWQKHYFQPVFAEPFFNDLPVKCE